MAVTKIDTWGPLHTCLVFNLYIIVGKRMTRIDEYFIRLPKPKATHKKRLAHKDVDQSQIHESSDYIDSDNENEEKITLVESESQVKDLSGNSDDEDSKKEDEIRSRCRDPGSSSYDEDELEIDKGRKLEEHYADSTDNEEEETEKETKYGDLDSECDDEDEKERENNLSELYGKSDDEDIESELERENKFRSPSISSDDESEEENERISESENNIEELLEHLKDSETRQKETFSSADDDGSDEENETGIQGNKHHGSFDSEEEYEDNDFEFSAKGNLILDEEEDEDLEHELMLINAKHNKSVDNRDEDVFFESSSESDTIEYEDDGDDRDTEEVGNIKPNVEYDMTDDEDKVKDELRRNSKHNEIDNVDEDNWNQISNQKKRKKLKTTKTKGSKSKKIRVDGLTLEQHRRKMGDAVKSMLSMEKYCMKAECHTTIDIAMEVFKELVVPNSSRLTPETFTTTTPVVVALIKGPEAAGKIFGKTKIRGGNRYEQCEMEKCDIVFFPPSGEARIWWVMY